MAYLMAVMGLLFFVVPVWCYRRGLKDGLALKEGAKTVESIPTPVQYVEQKKQEKETKEKADLINEGWQNIMNY